MRAQTEGALAVLSQATMRMARVLALREAASSRQAELHRAAAALQLPRALLRMGKGRGALFRPAGAAEGQGGEGTAAGGAAVAAAATAEAEPAASSASMATSAVLSLSSATLSVMRRRRGSKPEGGRREDGAADNDDGAPEAPSSGWLPEQTAEEEAAAAATPAAGASAASAWDEARKDAAALSPAQQQSLAKESRAVEERLGDLAHEVGRAEATLMELARMQNEISAHLAAQEEKIISVQTDTTAAVDNVEAGNEELAQALQFNRDFRWGMLLVFLLLSATLLFLDAFYP